MLYCMCTVECPTCTKVTPAKKPSADTACNQLHLRSGHQTILSAKITIKNIVRFDPQLIGSQKIMSGKLTLSRTVGTLPYPPSSLNDGTVWFATAAPTTVPITLPCTAMQHDAKLWFLLPVSGQQYVKRFMGRLLLVCFLSSYRKRCKRCYLKQFFGQLTRFRKDSMWLSNDQGV